MDKLKIAIIGSGSTYTPELIEGLIQRRDNLPLRELALMDIDSRKLQIVGSLAKRMVEHEKLGCRFVLTESLDAALEGADFVFVQIRVGKLPARILDEKIPLKHNLIGQETTGIGGFFKALRTIPVLLDIGKRMEELCPDAWMINFSNPSGICAQAMHKYGKTPMYGLCNAPIHMLQEPLEAFGLEEAEVDYVGLNHLSFVTSVRSGGRDYMREAANGNDELLQKLSENQGIDSGLLRLIRSTPSGYLQYFHHPRETLKKLQAGSKSRGEKCLEIEEELLALYQDEGLYIKPALLSERGGSRYSEVAVSLAESIWLDRQDVHVVNTLNNGALDFMADDDVVETKARIGRKGAETIPVVLDDNPYVKALMRTVKAYERHTVEAAVHGDREEALRALMINPLIGDSDVAKACFEEMLEAHKAYLPQF